MNEQTIQKPRPKTRSWMWLLFGALGTTIMFVTFCGLCSLSAGIVGSGTSGPSFGPAVAVVRVEGTIFSGESISGWGSTAGSETIIDLIEQAEDDPSIRAIVLRIDSPGGEVVAADEIHHALTQVTKPVIVSMGAMAASGGYYIAMPADYVYATPHTLTGSIGVISQFVVADDLLDEIGVEMIVITSGTMKDFGSPYRDMTEEEQAHWQTLSDEIHDAFIQIVADGRRMNVEEVRPLAQGQIYSGLQAVELGLVDEIGYLDDAIAEAAERGGIEGEPRVIELEPEVDLLSSLYGMRAQSGFMPTISEIVEMTSVPSLEFRYIGPWPQASP